MYTTIQRLLELSLIEETNTGAVRNHAFRYDQRDRFPIDADDPLVRLKADTTAVRSVPLQADRDFR